MSLMRDVTWHLEVIEKPDPLDVLEVEFVRDLHLRSAAGDAEDDYIEQAIRTAYRMAERTTRRALAPQTLALVIDERFPCGDILLPRPPLLSVSSIAYIDGDGAEQELTGSPAEFQVSTPSGPQAGYGRLRPLYGQPWPTTRCVLDAVTVTYRAGYPEEEGDPVDSGRHRQRDVAGHRGVV
jgi:uncharacterized phiE125 gp8 family phage protein